VTAGLGIIAHGIENGEIDAVGYTPKDLAQFAKPNTHPPKVPAINLELMQRRIVLDEGAVDSMVEVDAPIESGQALVWVGEDGSISAVESSLGQSGKVAEGQGGRAAAVLAVDFDEQVLMITTHYRFLLATPRQLADWNRMGLTLGDMHKLEREERVCALANWTAVSKLPKLLLATSAGVARPYPTNVLATSIQAPIPFKFDHPLDGIVVAALGITGKEELVMTTRAGKGVRWPVKSLRTSGTQAINLNEEDRVTGAVVVGKTDELLLLTADGYGRRLAAEWVFAPEKPNQKGKSLVSRRGDVVGTAVSRKNSSLWAITETQILPISTEELPLEASTKTKQLIKTESEEPITGIILLPSL
jgi:DNA gyrase subunit A